VTRSTPEPVNIVLFSSFPHLGWGGQESLLQLVARFDPTQFRPIVVVPEKGSLSRQLDVIGVDVQVVNLPRISLENAAGIASGLCQLIRIIKRSKAAVLHTDGPRNTFYAALIGRFICRPVIWHVRAWTKDPFDRLLYCLSSKLILVATGLHWRFPFRGSSRECTVIHNGVDLRRFRPATTSASDRNRWGIGRDEIVITAVGRIESQKGQDILIRACNKIYSGRLRLLFAGSVTDPGYKSECDRVASKLGCDVSVQFLGHITDMPGLMAVTDIFVLPSTYGEGFPRSVLEAMACGRPVIVTKTGGAAEAVEDGISGFVVAPGNPEELARKIIMLAADQHLRIKMGAAGRERAEKLYDINLNYERTVAVYREVIQKHRIRFSIRFAGAK